MVCLLNPSQLPRQLSYISKDYIECLKITKSISQVYLIHQEFKDVPDSSGTTKIRQYLAEQKCWEQCWCEKGGLLCREQENRPECLVVLTN